MYRLQITERQKIEREMTNLLRSLEQFPAYSLEAHQALKKVSSLAIRLRRL